MAQESVFAEVKIREPGVCQVASAAEPAATITDVSRTAFTSDERSVTEEFEVENSSVDGWPAAESIDEANGIYRLRRPKRQGCACELVERYDCPVRSIHVEGGHLSVTFYARTSKRFDRLSWIFERVPTGCISGVSIDPVVAHRRTSCTSTEISLLTDNARPFGRPTRWGTSIIPRTRMRGSSDCDEHLYDVRRASLDRTGETTQALVRRIAGRERVSSRLEPGLDGREAENRR